MPKVFVTRKIPDTGLEILKKKYEVEVFSDSTNPTKEEFINGAKDADAIVSLLSDPIDREIIESCKNLKVIANYAVGYDNIDLDAAKENNISVTNTPDVLTQATADLTWTLLLSAARRIIESDKFVRDLKYKGWGPELLLGQRTYGKTLGIIGFGRIGKAVAQRAKGFNMNVLYNKRTPLDKVEENKLNATYAELDELIKSSDFITINASLNESTYHLIDKQELKNMKETAVIVNTGRGPIINEKELANALKNKEIFAAGLDVYEKEPEIYHKLLELDNVVLTPHTGSATTYSRYKMSEMVAEDVIAVLEGRKPNNKVI
ncbi:MAG: D-glycerate dehydrogenase [Halanaerobiales bacterium]|nr:D-glycerate dehydrogenase [Halanaerobiales bacterium]